MSIAPAAPQAPQPPGDPAGPRPPAPPPPQTTPVAILAQDPSIAAAGDPAGGPLAATVRIPAEQIEPGPRGARFHVVDYDSASGRLTPPPSALDRAPDPADPAFTAQNVYAVAARTLATCEAALGRRLRWSFDAHQLFLVPRAFAEANAFYAPEDRAIFLGYVPGAQPVLTALSHDVVAHETTHAILDGLRPRFLEPGLPDQDAYHEALADAVALLSVFSLPEVVGNLLPQTASGRLGAEELTAERLGDSALLKLGEQLGDAIHSGGGRGEGLRHSVKLVRDEAWRTKAGFEEPHRRGEVLVAAIMQTLLAIWTGRLAKPLQGGHDLDRERVVEEGAKAAAHLLRMLVRGIDYLPPVELEFEDVIEAVVTADAVVAADDDAHGYRATLLDTFAGWGIRPAGRIADLAQAAPQPAYERMNQALLRSDRDEVQRFLWENAERLGGGQRPGIDRRWQTVVQFVRPSMRVGPDGLVVPEVVADYVQSVQMTAGELAALPGAQVPDGLASSTQLELWGGGVLVFDQFGRAKLHGAKPLADWERQSRRLAHLVANGLSDAHGRFGFTLGTPRGQRFAAMHAGAEDPEESW